MREPVGEGVGIVEHAGILPRKLYTCPELCWDDRVDPDEAFRTAAAAWLATHAPALRARLDAAGRPRAVRVGRGLATRSCSTAGWAGITWPVEYGGRGGTAAQAAIFAREQARVRA